MTDDIIVLTDVRKTFRDFWLRPTVAAVDGLSLTVRRGEVFGLLGPNGSGKSTTIKMILGLLDPTGGALRLFGRSPRSVAARARLGYLPELSYLHPFLTAKETLRYYAGLCGLDRRTAVRRTEELLEMVGLAAVGGRPVGGFSKGMARRVALAASLIGKPELLVLDEPTSGLDPLIQREFYSILKERNLNGTTVFLSSHVLSEIERYCRRAAVIREGRLVACDSVEKLGHTGVKRVTLRKPLTAPDFHGIRDLKSENENVTFLYSGTADALIRELSLLSFEDITLEDPDLEDVFMHYYAKEEN